MAQLDAYYLATAAAVATAYGVPEGTRSSLRTTLSVVDGYRSRLDPDGDLGRAVLEGSLPVERWTRILNAQGEALQSVWGSLDSESIGPRLWNEVVIKSGSDLVEIGGQVADVAGDAASKLATEGPGLLKWAVVGLVAYVVLQVSRFAR